MPMFEEWFAKSPEAAPLRTQAQERAAEERAKLRADVAAAKAKFDKEHPIAAKLVQNKHAEMKAKEQELLAIMREYWQAKGELHSVEVRYQKVHDAAHFTMRDMLPDERIAGYLQDIGAKRDELQTGGGALKVVYNDRTGARVANQEAIKRRIEHLAMMQGEVNRLRMMGPVEMERTIQEYWLALPEIDKWDDPVLARSIERDNQQHANAVDAETSISINTQAIEAKRVGDRVAANRPTATI